MVEIYKDSRRSPEGRARSLMSKMTTEEKFAQLQCYSKIASLSTPMEEYCKNGIGEISNLIATVMPNPEAVANMIEEQQRIVMKQSRFHIPAFLHVETLCGVLSPGMTVVPEGISQASSWNPDLEQKITHQIGQEGRALGFNQALSPVLDLCRDPRFGRLAETFGEDPVLAAAMGQAAVKGFQKDIDNGMLSTAKHFIAFMSGQGGIHGARSMVTDRELKETYATPFQAVITNSKIGSVMSSYASINGESVGVSKDILTKLLRDQLKFDGFTISDYGAIGNLKKFQGQAASLTEAGERALKAGLDSEAPSIKAFNNELLKKFKDGKISISILDRAVLRILEAKFKAGLFENPLPNINKLLRLLSKETGEKLSKKLTEQSLILLQNKDKTLPIDLSHKKVAVIGYHANSLITMFGGYTYMAMKENSIGISMSMAGVHVDKNAPARNSSAQKTYPGSLVTKQNPKVEELARKVYPHMHTLLEELQKEFPKAKIDYAYGYPYTGNDTSHFEKALKLAKEADVVIVTLGGRYGWNAASTTGEEIDATNIGLPECQEEFLKELSKLHKTVIGVHFDGRPCSSDAADQVCDALIEAWGPAKYGPWAIARTISGKNNPSGHLPVTVARNSGQVPIFYNHEFNSSYDHQGGIFKGYHDLTYSPRYYFGHGLSYSSFAYSDLRLDKTEFTSNEKIKLSFKVKNTSNISGVTVAQIYATDPVATVMRPVQQLIGFKRISLKPGEEKKVNVEIDPSQLSFIDENNKWKIEAGEYQIKIGTASNEIKLEDSFNISKDRFLINPENRTIVAKVK